MQESGVFIGGTPPALCCPCWAHTAGTPVWFGDGSVSAGGTQSNMAKKIMWRVAQVQKTTVPLWKFGKEGQCGVVLCADNKHTTALSAGTNRRAPSQAYQTRLQAYNEFKKLNKSRFNDRLSGTVAKIKWGIQTRSEKAAALKTKAHHNNNNRGRCFLHLQRELKQQKGVCFT